MRPHELDWLWRRPIDHLGYVVEDIPAAVETWRAIGVGPFFLVPQMQFDALTRPGGPCRWDHAAAFARWGPVGIELQQMHDVRPPELAERIGVGRENGINHIAWVSPDPEADGKRLEALGFPQEVWAKSGPIEDQMHYIPALGHMVEIHRENELLSSVWAMVTEASRDWDGGDPIRPLEPPVRTTEKEGPDGAS